MKRTSRAAPQSEQSPDEQASRSENQSSRRDFLKVSSALGLGLAAGLDGKEAYAAPALVGMAKASSIEAATNTAIQLAGGLPSPAGKRCLLKVNLNTGDPSPYSPHPSIVRAVIQQLKNAGASSVCVADRSNPKYKTIDAAKKAGIYQVCTAMGVPFIDFAAYPFKKVNPAGATSWSGGFSITRYLDNIDYIVNMACCKHHVSANFTMAIKNWYGIVPQSDRSKGHSGNIRRMLPELHLGRKENFIVMDATKICLTKGPNPGGASAAPGIVVATKDIVANDVTGLAILLHYLKQKGISNSQITDYTCWTQPQIARATQIGIGIKNKAAYSAANSGVPEYAALMALVNK